MSSRDWYTEHVLAHIGRYVEQLLRLGVEHTRWYSFPQRANPRDARGVLGVLLVGLTNHRDQGGLVPLLEYGDTTAQCRRVARMFCEAANVPRPWPPLRWLTRSDTRAQTLALCLRRQRLPLELRRYIADLARSAFY
jgi:hypothetical protein